MSRKRKATSSPEGLAVGQLWKLNHFYVQVVELGKKLIYYRMLSDLRETGAKIKSSGIDVMWAYLQTRHARLVQGRFSELAEHT